MWKVWKKRINDFIFEEIDEELELEERQATTSNRQALSANVYASKYRSQAVRTKVTFEYPKKKQVPFRFPVIPDDETEISVKHDYVIEDAHPHRKRNAAPSPYYEPTRLIHGYQQKKALRELEDVPAFIRRRKQKEIERREQEKLEKERRKKQLEQKIRPELSHTTPDELDRVFRIRDGLDNELSPNNASDTEQMKKNLLFE